MNRKNFLKQLGLGLVAGTSMATSCEKGDNITTDNEDCKLTAKDDLGPFFVAGTSNIVNLNTQNLAGTPMLMMGKVYSGEGNSKPLGGAKIEIWHADDNGAYHPEGAGDVSQYPAAEVTLRGFVLTESDGSFSFKSIRPGLYGSRARHIHYKITAVGHQELVTQSYFLGDTRISQDELSKNAGDCRIVTYSDDGSGGIMGTMDFNIQAS